MDKFTNKRLLSMKEYCEYVGLGETKAREIARKIGAVRHIGRRTLIDKTIVDKALDDFKSIE